MSFLKKKADFSSMLGAGSNHNSSNHVSATGMGSQDRFIKGTEEPVRLSGLVWKRRGGIGKFMSSMDNHWELRKMELRGTKLLYYSNPAEDMEESSERSDEYDNLRAKQNEFANKHQSLQQNKSNWLLGHAKAVTSKGLEQAKAVTSKGLEQAKAVTSKLNNSMSSLDRSLPRGFLDLKEEKAVVNASFGHSGAPSPFCISIVVGLASETKWKLSFDSQKDQMLWLAAMTDVVVQCSVDEYNVQLLQAANPHKKSQIISDASLPLPLFRPPPVYEPRDKDADSNGLGGTVGNAAHQLWMTDSYNIQNDGKGNTEITPTVATDTPAAVKSDLNDAIENSMEVMRQLHQAEIKKLKRQSLEKINESEQKVVSLQQLMDDAKEEHEKAINTLKEELLKSAATSIQDAATEQKQITKREIESIHAQETAKLNDDTKLLHAQMDEKINQLQKELSDMQEKHQESLKALEEKHQQSLKALEEEYKQKLDDERKLSENKIDIAVKEAKDDVIGPLQQQLIDKDKKISEMSSEMENLRTSMERKNKSLEDLQSCLGQEQQESIKSIEDDWKAKIELQKKTFEEEEQSHKDKLLSLKKEYEERLNSQKKEIEEEMAEHHNASFRNVQEVFIQKLESKEKEVESLRLMVEKLGTKAESKEGGDSNDHDNGDDDDDDDEFQDAVDDL